jgi:c-di-GMP-binding flagellar brake protein YcgR
MTQRANSLLGDATQEELNACIRLLAMSVVQHRAASGFVPFRDSALHLRADHSCPEKAGLFVQTRDLVEEALETVRVLAAATPQESPEAPDATPTEKRKQMRINVTAPVTLLWTGTDETSRARLQNISWGGAAIRVDSVPAGAGDTLQLLLPGTRGEPINIGAKVLRTWELSDGQGTGIAVRFSSLATRDEDELEEVLKLLAQSADSDGLRQHARLTQRLDIQFDGADELHATLDDISAGGLGVTVPDPLEIGQSLQAVISTLNEDCTLKLRARVVRLEPVTMGNVALYQAGLKFEHPIEELTELTGKLINEMVAKRA